MANTVREVPLAGRKCWDLINTVLCGLRYARFSSFKYTTIDHQMTLHDRERYSKCTNKGPYRSWWCNCDKQPLPIPFVSTLCRSFLSAHTMWPLATTTVSYFCVLERVHQLGQLSQYFLSQRPECNTLAVVFRIRNFVLWWNTSVFQNTEMLCGRLWQVL